MSETIDTVKALEERRYAAMVAADGDTMNELFADALCYTHSHGGMDTKAEYIGNLTSGRAAYRSVHRMSENYVEYDNAVIISSRVQLEVTAGGIDRTIHAQATITWVRSGGRWQFAAWQSTPVAA
jgi:Domain of unknown function (DUF4440)